MRGQTGTVLVLGIGAFIGLALLGFACHPKAGCRMYDNMGIEATYCRLHREAVWDYVERSGSKTVQKGRADAISRLVEELKKCSTLECLKSEISADTIAEGFSLIYNQVHQQAELGFNGVRIETRQVVMCGLENGLRDWVDSLKLDHSLQLENSLD